MEPARRASEPAGRVAEQAVREPEPAVRAPEPAGRALEPGERALESARRVSGLAGRALMRALEPAERALESAGRPFEPSWEAQSDLGGPAGNSRGGHRERETDTEWSVPGMWWYNIGHHPLRGRCPKRRRRTSIMIMKINGSSAGLEWAAEIWQIMVSFGANQYSSFRSLSVSV